MSEQFRELQWKVDSIDCNPNSNATIIMDIRNLTLQNLSSVPDVLWASIPCITFSKMNGGKDHDPSDWNKSSRSREHDEYLLKTFALMNEAKWHHEHLIVVIENPVGKLRNAPCK